MIVIKDGTYFSRFWFLTDGRTRDFMAALFREDGLWKCVGRYRFYIPGREQDPDAPDPKRWFSVSFPSESRGIEAIGKLVGLLAAADFGKDPETVIIGSDRAEDVMRAWEAQPWVSVSTVPQGAQ